MHLIGSVVLIIDSVNIEGLEEKRKRGGGGGVLGGKKKKRIGEMKEMEVKRVLSDKL